MLSITVGRTLVLLFLLVAGGCADVGLPAAPTALPASGSGALATTSSRPAESCRNVEAHVVAQLDPVTGTAAGTVSGDLSGTVTAAIHGIAGNPNGAQHVTMEHHYTTAEGRIDTEDNATLAPLGGGIYRMNNRLEITGGTGSYSNASGYLHTHGTVNFGTGAIILDLKGRVCR